MNGGRTNPSPAAVCQKEMKGIKFIYSRRLSISLSSTREIFYTPQMLTSEFTGWEFVKFLRCTQFYYYYRIAGDIPFVKVYLVPSRSLFHASGSSFKWRI